MKNVGGIQNILMQKEMSEMGARISSLTFHEYFHINCIKPLTMLHRHLTICHLCMIINNSIRSVAAAHIDDVLLYSPNNSLESQESAVSHFLSTHISLNFP